MKPDITRPDAAAGTPWQEGPGKSYDAFISYAHDADKVFAPVLQRGLQQLGKPWNRRRAMEVFRDETSLPISPGLWPSIRAALDASRWFTCCWPRPWLPGLSGSARRLPIGYRARAQIICWSWSPMAPGSGTTTVVISAPPPPLGTMRSAVLSQPSPTFSI